MILSSSGDQTIRYWDTEAGEELRRYGAATNINNFAVTPDGLTVLLSHGDTNIVAREFDLWSAGQSMGGHTEKVTAIATSSDGRLAISASLDGTLRLWNLGAEIELRRFDIAPQTATMDLSPGGLRLLIGDFQGNAILWDVERNEESHRFSGHAGIVVGVAFTPDGQLSLIHI